MDSTLACLATWMPRQRWYAGKGRAPALRLVSWWDAEPSTAHPNARVRTYLVSDEASLPPVLYQVPVVIRETADVDVSPDHIIGSPEPGFTFVDGPFDPAYAAALLRLIVDGERGSGPQADAAGHRAPAVGDIPVPGPASRAHVMAGEQSNTSLVYRGDGDEVICKIYRQPQPGVNPDIELSSALAAAGSAHVPRAVGWVDAHWPDSATAHGSVSGSLAFAQEFLPGVQDAWRVALRAAADGAEFTAEAAGLGAATAETHAILAQLFPTRDADADDRARTVQTWRRRLSIAIAEVPEIRELEEGIESVYRAGTEGAWPALQRIHGDLHLGQVLHVADRGWILVDFEGEPLRPIAERRRGDLALRDVAGVLRSFDYVAGSLRQDAGPHGADDARAWARAARRAFLGAYVDASGIDLAAARPLLTALELDKAVYEAIYEARNRPTWTPIPVRAAARLVSRSAASR
ncbi:maltokinase N-terminal cap-like domain-containing protein [Microbacterium hominis]|uniref:Maltokinase n=1 Tax=Microbacterium hominis TaxID=162426 RepID=A0A7D4PLX8_9MICO|nr:aminoglycoside phosphotransferase [Microbacterium hominis]QKJ19150.1 aminoglycoside phosphotransferase [Microbacterium hominis]